MPSIFKPDWLPKGPAIIEHTAESEPVKALQIEDIERVVHESIFHPMKALEDVIKTLEIQNKLLKEIVNDNLIKRQYHDDFAQLGLTLNYRLVYHRHTYVYLYSATAFTLAVSDGSSQAIPANYYVLLNYPEGVYLTVSGGSDTSPILCRFRSCDVQLEPGTQQMTFTNSTIAATQSGAWNVGQSGVWTVGQTSDYPSGATPITADSGNQANATATATLAANAAQRTWITGFLITSSGATGASVVAGTITGVVGGTLHFTYVAVAGATLADNTLAYTFGKPIPSSAINTAIAVSIPALGAGNTNTTVNAFGYQLT